MESFGRIRKALILSLGITLASLMPLFLFHIFAPIFAPVIGGYLAGEHFELSAKEAAILGVVLIVLIGVPAPAAHHIFGAFSYLSSLSIDFFSVVGAIYMSGLVGLVAWLGGEYGSKDTPWGPRATCR